MKMKALLLLSILTFMTPLYSCPLEGLDKDQLISDLWSMDVGVWSSNRLNEMIILAKYEKLPPEATTKGNRTLAALSCELG